MTNTISANNIIIEYTANINLDIKRKIYYSQYKATMFSNNI